MPLLIILEAVELCNTVIPLYPTPVLRPQLDTHSHRRQVSCVDAKRDADNDRVEHTAQLKHAGRDLQPV
jgi:hypothetical protein